MAITRDSRHKRRATGGRRHPHQKKRKYEVGKPPAMTKIGTKRIHLVRGRGGTNKHRAMRLEQGNFAWGSEHVTHKTRILDVVYNASNNELVRTKTLVKSAVVVIDATPFVSWYKTHYRQQVVKRNVEGSNQLSLEEFVPEAGADKKNVPEGAGSGKAALARVQRLQKDKVVDPRVEEQFVTGRLLAVISTRPGQSGRCDGYILEGPELAFYQKQLAAKKTGKGAK